MTRQEPGKIWAAQLDLARQKETVETVIDFARFVADAGYNTLLLYLEAIVRTPSFNELPESMSYGAHEIRRIVQAAEEAGLEVVPCISTLGHAEHFFRVERMKSLAETVKAQPLMTFCTSNPDTYAFLERYLAEVAELFPAPHLHVGLDEAWQMGRCPRCKPRVGHEDGFMGIFLDHILRMHRITGDLGKRMWMWDDLLEYASDEMLARIPRDVLMCMWSYNSQAMHRRAGLQGHFDQLRRHNTLARYQKLGFEVLLSPGASGTRNIYEQTQYGRRYPNAGGLMTIWELGRRFLPGTLPMFLFGGILWQHPDLSESEAIDQTIQRLFPANLQPDEHHAIAAALLEPVSSAMAPAAMLRGPLTLYEHHMLAAAALHEGIFARLLRRTDLTVPQRQILEEMWLRAAGQRISKRLQILQQDLIDPISPNKLAAAAAVSVLAEELRQQGDFRVWQWQAQRPGLEPEKAGRALHEIADAWDAFAEKWSTPSPTDLLLEVDLFLWDGYAAPRLRVELLHGDDSRIVGDTSYKPLDLRQSQYTSQFPIRLEPHTPLPDAVRFTVSGYGGQGIRFARLLTASSILEPATVLGTSGTVSDPHHVLIDHSLVCYLGSTDMIRTLMMQLEHEESSLTLSLTSVNG